MLDLRSSKASKREVPMLRRGSALLQAGQATRLAFGKVRLSVEGLAEVRFGGRSGTGTVVALRGPVRLRSPEAKQILEEAACEVQRGWTVVSRSFQPLAVRRRWPGVPETLWDGVSSEGIASEAEAEAEAEADSRPSGDTAVAAPESPPCPRIPVPEDGAGAPLRVSWLASLPFPGEFQDTPFEKLPLPGADPSSLQDLRKRFPELAEGIPGKSRGVLAPSCRVPEPIPGLETSSHLRRRYGDGLPNGSFQCHHDASLYPLLVDFAEAAMTEMEQPGEASRQAADTLREQLAQGHAAGGTIYPFFFEALLALDRCLEVCSSDLASQMPRGVYKASQALAVVLKREVRVWRQGSGATSFRSKGLALLAWAAAAGGRVGPDICGWGKFRDPRLAWEHDVTLHEFRGDATLANPKQVAALLVKIREWGRQAEDYSQERGVAEFWEGSLRSELEQAGEAVPEEPPGPSEKPWKDPWEGKRTPVPGQGGVTYSHVGKGPNGGQLLELSKGKHYMEFVAEEDQIRLVFMDQHLAPIPSDYEKFSIHFLLPKSEVTWESWDGDPEQVKVPKGSFDMARTEDWAQGYTAPLDCIGRRPYQRPFGLMVPRASLDGLPYEKVFVWFERLPCTP